MRPIGDPAARVSITCVTAAPGRPRRLRAAAAAFLLLALPGLGGAFGDLASGDGPLQVAERIYADVVSVHPVRDEAFSTAFPGLQLLIVKEGRQHPEILHALAYDASAAVGWDLTTQFNEVLRAEGVALARDNVLTYAKAVAHLQDLDLHAQRVVVDGADADEIGRTVDGPVVVPVEGGWDVRLSTYAEENGVLADWTLRFDALPGRLVSARWDVRETAVGPYVPESHAVALASDVSALAEYTVTGFARRIFRGDAEVSGPQSLGEPWREVFSEANYDCTRWSVEFDGPLMPDGSAPPDVLYLARVLADAGERAYRAMTAFNANCDVGAVRTWNPASANWTFESRAGANGVPLRIQIQDRPNLGYWIVVYDGYDPRIVTTRDFLVGMRGLGYYADASDDAIAGALIGHETFHTLQWVLSEYRGHPWYAYIEGQARFAQTVLEPDTEHGPTSTFYSTVETTVDDAGGASPGSSKGRNGVNHFQYAPYESVCSHSYSYALFWGFLYQHDGGMPVIQRTLERVRDLPAFASCETGLPTAVTEALASTGSPHATYQDALLDFGDSVVSKDFAWGRVDGTDVKDWGRTGLLVDVKKDLQGEGTASYATGAWGLRYVAIGPKPLVDHLVSCSPAPGDAWSLEILVPSRPAVPCTASPVRVDGLAQAVVKAVALDATSGRFSVTVEERLQS